MTTAYAPHFLPSKTTSSSSTPPSLSMSQDELKKIAAYKAVDYIKPGMVVGLGTGSTAKHAVDRIGDLIQQGVLTNIIGIPTSLQTEKHALSVNIPLSNLETHSVIDISIDGADEVDPDLNLVKGRGGSLLREKMIEFASKQFVVIVDDSKLVDYIGGSGLALPVEVVPFCWKFTANKLEFLFKDSGCVVKIRKCDETGDPFVTDNGNYTIDLFFERSFGDLKAAGDAILRLPGVVEHGMFVGMANVVIVAGEDGVTVKNRTELIS